ncbi:FERM, ARHGEF and pleckstrin domain-containing protein 2 isoform X1 [Pocillopora verrucosa]|uniref:FERM, ARHGEF and pleckstrin domain-containing protein 2 isoform X1 n=1 Tax=Pocillopora verrucosa TaxID=203993 RepID=UPI00333F3B1A
MSRRYDMGEQDTSATHAVSNRRKVTVKVCMLDDSVVKFDIEPKGKGKSLYDNVYECLNLEEREYFGLSFYDKNDNLFWLDDIKPLNKQVKDLRSTLFRCCVKFYPPDPASLQEEYTRYLFGLQIKRDLLSGRLKCSENTAALLASYVVQGELGDYDSMSCRPGYLSEFQFFPGQTADSEKRISTYHKEHRGLLPADADYNLLDVARRLEMYGMILYPAKDKDDVELYLAAAHMGVCVFQNGAKINTFSWAKIRKLSFKRRRFLLKLHPEIFGHYKDVVEFLMASRNACKSFWKIAITTHAFFRQNVSNPVTKSRPRILSRGSSYRYSGRTQKQIIEGCRTTFRQQPPFQRSQSMKTPTRHNSMGNSSQPSPMFFSGLSENTPPRSLIPLQEKRPLSSNGPTTSISHEDRPQETPPEEDLVTEPLPEKKGAIPLQDLDDEPDMMREESDTPSEAQSEADLEWQTEPLEVAPASTTEASVNVHEFKETTDGKPREAVENIDGEFERDTPLNYCSGGDDHNVDEKVLIPEECVRIEYQPQPKPPSPVEVSDVDTMSPPPPSPPPPPPEDEEDDEIPGEIRDEGVGQEFPSPPPELLPSPPPELLNDFENSEEVERPIPVVPHNGFQEENQKLYDKEGENRDEKRDSAKLNITCSSIVTKVQNGGVTRHGKGSRGSRHSTDSGATSDSGEARDTMYDELSSPFRSDIETSPPVSPTSPISFQKGAYISKELYSAAHNVARELLNTERTFVKDLEVITIAFRDVVNEDSILPEERRKLLFSTFDPIYDFHCSFLSELEQRMNLWDKSGASKTNESPRMGDLLLRNMKQIKRYLHHVKRHAQVMLELEDATNNYRDFEVAYKEFETQKVCYLPFSAFILKPSQRIVHYKSLLERLLKFYPTEHIDHKDTQRALEEVNEAVKAVEESIRKLENFQKIIELERDLLGVENLVQPGREFIREGCLQKIDRKGPQPRMFFLFSDILLYTFKGVTLTNQFRVRGQIPLDTIRLENSGPEMHGLYSFTIISEAREIHLAAGSEEEKYKWMEDLKRAVKQARDRVFCGACSQKRSNFAYRTPKMRSTRFLCEECYSDLEQEELHNGDTPYPQMGSGDKVLPLPTPVEITGIADGDGSDDEINSSPVSSLERRHAHTHTMSTRRVCWHRNTSISMIEHSLSVRNQMSGELLRKFKTGNRWQKLWVVFTNFCLFFYKTHEDEFPLASLPLIGYSVGRPVEADGIDKDLVFKLQYKTHVYFFRAENEYTFYRWMEVITGATQSSSRVRLFSRQISSVH